MRSLARWMFRSAYFLEIRELTRFVRSQPRALDPVAGLIEATKREAILDALEKLDLLER